VFDISSDSNAKNRRCAYSEEDDLAIVVTAYQPDPNVWMDFKRRRGK